MRRQGYLSDIAVAQRLGGYAEWLKSLLGSVLGLEDNPTDTEKLRFVLIDGSTVQVPGATFALNSGLCNLRFLLIGILSRIAKESAQVILWLSRDWGPLLVTMHRDDRP